MAADEKYGAYRQIMAAARAGKISPQRALHWARRAAGGESVEVLAALSPSSAEDRRRWSVQAATTDLAQQVLEILTQLLDQAQGGTAYQGGSDEFGHLFPPSAPLGHVEYPPAPLVYEAPDEKGRRKLREGFASPHFPASMPYASASPYVEDLPDEELHDLLFGDTSGEEAG